MKIIGGDKMLEEIKKYEEKMQKTIKALENEYNSIRAGRANPHVLDKITVEYYGQATPLQQVGNVSVPEPRMIQIQPWDTSMMKEIEKAILASDVGITPNNDGKVIRLVFPELTEERRKSLTKDVKKKGEEAKVAVRNIRRDALDKFKKQLKNHEITEDDLKDYETDMQKLTDKYVKDIDVHVENKTKEILTV
jgi:ribosome recycling factor